jgi:predicted N-acetyltransferase YhbS
MPVKKGRISGESKVATLGDPEYYPNAKSSREINTQLKPEKPGDQ